MHTNLPVDQGWSTGTGSVGSRSTGSAGPESADDILGGAVGGVVVGVGMEGGCFSRLIIISVEV